MDIRDWRLTQAKTMCDYCKKRGAPDPVILTLTETPVYVHHFMDAAGDSDWSLCDANDFLKRLDKFLCIDGKERTRWTAPMQETGSVRSTSTENPANSI